MIKYLKQNEILLALCIQVVLVHIGVGLISPILPQYAQTFGVSVTMIGLLTTAFGAARMALDIPAGNLAVRLGRRPLLLAGPLIIAVSSTIAGLSTEYWQLLVFQFIQGAGAAFLSTAAFITLADISSPSNRGQVISLFQGGMLLGAGIGPAMGGFIAEYFGFRVPFFAFAALAALSFIWAFFRLPETRQLTHPPDRPTHGNVADIPAGQSGTGFAMFTRDFNFILICMMTFGIIVMRIGSLNQTLPLLGSDRLGLTEGLIGVAMALIAVTQFITIFVGGRLSDRFGRKAVIVPGFLLAAVALVMLAFTQSYVFLLLTCVAMGIGIGVSAPTVAAYAIDIMPREHYGKGMGLYRAANDLGFVIGPIFLGWLVDINGYSFSLLFNAVFLLAVVLTFQLMAREPQKSRVLPEVKT